MAVRPQNWNEIINKDDDNEDWADPGARSSGRSLPSNGHHNDNSEGEEEEDTWGGERGTRIGKRKKDGIGNGMGNATEEGKGKGKGNGKWKGIAKETPGGDCIYRAIAFQSQKEMYVADSDTEG